jgi:acyl-CoA thioester hydrolase
LNGSHQIRFKVPFGDVDMMGHVNNARYLTYFETARTEHMLASFGRHDPREAGVIIAHAEIDYRSPAKWNDELTINIRPSSVGTKSWVYEYKVLNEKDGNRLIAEGKTVQVAFNYATGKTVLLPDPVKTILLKQIEESKH